MTEKTHADAELQDIDELRMRTEANRAREIPRADATIAAAYAEKYDGDLRIFLHQLCEISSIIGQPYDGAFDLHAGRFEWNQGVVVLHAGPDRRSVLVTEIDQFSNETLARLSEFCQRCAIRHVQEINNEPLNSYYIPYRMTGRCVVRGADAADAKYKFDHMTAVEQIARSKMEDLEYDDPIEEGENG
jgi:hypothetical protein